MIRKDFETGGFPLQNLSPAICIDANYNFHMAYNRFELITLLRTKDIKTCFGIWPGKKNTDGFIMDPKIYVALPLPPEEHKEIDNAIEITVYMEGEKFSRMSYFLNKDEVKIESKDSALFNYVKKVGLRFSLVFE